MFLNYGAKNKIVCSCEEVTGTEVTNLKTVPGSSLDDVRFRDNDFFHDIQRHVSNDQAYGRLSGNKIYKKCTDLSNIPAVTLPELC
jgi:hypothetical protein